MEDGSIQGTQITASSVYQGDQSLVTTTSRLNGPKAWYANINDLNQWIQVDLGVSTLVSGVVMQGRDYYPQWVIKYKVQYSGDINAWFYVRDAFYAQDDIVSLRVRP